MNNTLPWLNPQRIAGTATTRLARRILVIDGAMGTMLQSHQLDETGYRGARFVDGRDRTHLHEHARDRATT